MKNDTRSNVHHRHTALCLALSAALFSAPVSAEVGLTPPAQHQGAGFPSEQALRQKGYDPKTGVWRVQSQNNGRPTVTKSGDNIKGTQSKTVTATGNYGEKGTFRTTQTQTVSSSKLQNTINGVWAGGALAAAVDKHSGLMGARIRSGDYKGAVESGVLMAGTFGNNLFGGFAESLGNIGRGLGLIDSPSPQDFRQAGDRFYQWQMQQEKNGDFSKAVEAAAAKKAAEQAAKAAQGNKEYKEAKERSKKETVYQVVLGITHMVNGRQKSENKYIGAYTNKFADNAGASYDKDGKQRIIKSSPLESYLPGSWSPNSIIYANLQVVSERTPPPETVTPQDMMLNQQDIKDILSRMLNNQQTNHAELMNQLAKIGDAVEKSTESNQFTPMTADSAPYTPQGSNTPQQTRFTLNADGSVSTSIIPRPDLKPNSTLAPTRSEIIPTPNKGQNTPTTPNSPNTPTTPDSPNAPTTQNQPNTPTTPDTPTGQQNQNQNQENQKQDFCQKNPNAAQCMPGGDTTYEDIVLPENTIDLSFSPENVFQTEGVCPQPKSVDLGAFGQVEFSYQPLCDFAAKLRPVLIMMTILTCAWFVYGALEEL
jgi:putative integumentary mucin A.1|nr:MAG TPA: attachment protein [Inoviridae sp.]